MKGDASSKPVTAGHRNSSRVRLLDGGCREEKPDRRAFLRAMAVQGVSLPAAYFMLGRGLGDRPVPEAQAAGKTGAYRKGAMRHPTGAGDGGSNPGLLVRDFADPYIELLRLLREASEIEHALMIQYLYAAFSVKPAYESLVGFGPRLRRPGLIH